MASAKDFLTEEEKNAVVEAIRKVELSTCGEIRVHVDDRCEEDVYDRAIKVFRFLRMEKTPFRNAVLFYIAVKDRKFAVIGDEAINNKVGAGYWEHISKELHDEFHAGHYGKGIVKAVEIIGETLIKHFPDIDQPDSNKLPDDISFE